MLRRSAWILILVVLAAISGCGSVHNQSTVVGSDDALACRGWLDRLDEITTRAGVRDAASHPLDGFPSLRSNRFLEALGARATTTEQQVQWRQLMEDLDLQARTKEIRNLPEPALAAVSTSDDRLATRQDLLSRVRSCSRELSDRIGMDAATLATLRTRARLPDEYSRLARFLGLFPFSSVPVTLITERAKHRAGSWYSGPLEDRPIMGKLELFAPPDRPQLSSEETSRMLQSSQENPLRIHALTEPQKQALAQALAPVLWQDVAAPYDVPGRVISDGGRPSVDPGRPTVYYYASQAIIRDRPVLQMNFVIWYAARAGQTPPWIERGRLDGLTLRVSLDTQGKPFLVDAINNCGCYHFLVPRRGTVTGVKVRKAIFPPLVPQWLPDLRPAQRIEFRVSSGWHQVERIMAADKDIRTTPYELLPYESLESYQDIAGTMVSLFDSQGLVPGSERPERFLLYGMGIPHIGNMRQRGHHAISFGDPEHFDDPYLIEKLLDFDARGDF